jgi:hypothetical protein
VWTLLELVRHALRNGQPQVALLFVDFRKAYDTVHRETLWFLLRHMGVPERLVAVLRHWNLDRHTQLRMDGVDGEPYTVNKGVAQGDVLSPLLFDLYIEGLNRFLNSVNGVGLAASAGGRTLRVPDLMYADDVCVPCTGRLAAQLACDAVERWRVDFGLEVGGGRGKTEAVMICGPSCVPTPESDTTTAMHIGATPVQWVPAYKYLGYVINQQLDGTAFFTHKLSVLASLITRLFISSDVMGVNTIASQLEALKTFAISPVLYLLCMHPAGRGGATGADNVLERMDTWVRRAVRRIFGIPHVAPVSAVLATARLLPFPALVVRERTRLWLDLCHPIVATDVAPQLLTILAAEPRRPRTATLANGDTLHLANWAHDTADMLAGWCPGTSVPLPLGPWDHPRCASVFTRAGAMQRWAAGARKAAGIADTRRVGARPLPREPNIGRAEGALTPAPPINHTAVLHFNFFPCDSGALGADGWHTPLSVWGPACSGSPLSLTRLPAHVVDGISRLSLGRLALGYPPFAVNGVAVVPHAAVPLADEVAAAITRAEAAMDGDDPDGDADSDTSVTAPRSGRARRRRVQARLARLQPGDHDCPLCGRLGQTYEHLLLDCPARELADVRSSLIPTARALIRRLCSLLLRWSCLVGQRSVASARLTASAMAPAVSAVLAACDAAPFTDADGRFVLYRLSVMATWPAAPVGPSWTLAHALGRLFDSIRLPPQRLRAAMDTWGRWCATTLRRVATAWHLAQHRRVRECQLGDGPSRAAALALARQYAPVGALFHLSLPWVCPAWTGPVNGVCEFCLRQESQARVMFSDPFCNLVVCDACLRLPPAACAELEDGESALAWLCPLCADMWLRRALRSSSDAAWSTAQCASAQGSATPLPGASGHRLRVSSVRQRHDAAAAPSAACRLPLLYADTARGRDAAQRLGLSRHE